jgi:hypothetical protein
MRLISNADEIRVAHPAQLMPCAAPGNACLNHPAFCSLLNRKGTKLWGSALPVAKTPVETGPLPQGSPIPFALIGKRRQQ